VLPGLIGTIQATETIKLILGAGEPLVGRLLLVDALRMQFRTVRLRKDPACPACGTREIQELVDYDDFCGVTQADAAAAAEGLVPEVTPRELADRLRRGDEVDVVDVREPHEWEIAHIPGARLVPLATLTEALPTLDSARDIVVHCKSGARSARAVRQLQAAGYRRVWNLAGGITRWSDEVDPRVPRY
jgi:adenylyltransferase/sulfurtransferase